MSPPVGRTPLVPQTISTTPAWFGHASSHGGHNSDDEFDDNSDIADDDKLNAPSSSLARRRNRISAIIVLAMCVIALLGALVGWFGAQKLLTSESITVSTKTQLLQVMEKPCGKTADEARARGCYFDVISFCWLPERCYDAELSQRFDRSTEWEWYMDPNRTQPLSHQQIMTGEHTGLYVNWKYHLVHCTSMWEKMHRALMGPHEKMAIDSYIGSYEHTKHCGHMLMSERDLQLDVINTIILVKFPDCGMR